MVIQLLFIKDIVTLGKMEEVLESSHLYNSLVHFLLPQLIKILMSQCFCSIQALLGGINQDLLNQVNKERISLGKDLIIALNLLCSILSFLLWEICNRSNHSLSSCRPLEFSLAFPLPLSLQLGGRCCFTQ